MDIALEVFRLISNIELCGLVDLRVETTWRSFRLVNVDLDSGRLGALVHVLGA
jgi:hypothetical protein